MRETSVCRVSAGHASDMAEQQRKLFKKLDDYRFEASLLSASTHAQKVSYEKNDLWYLSYTSCFGDLRQAFPASTISHTVVYEAFVFLVKQGLFNVKDTQHVNIKQARAVLHFAHWLQQRLSQLWIGQDLLSPPAWPLSSEALLHALIGGPGTAKTTTTKIINGFLEHFLGPECMPQSAPTNTAARLIGGNTVDARYKLPRGSLLSVKGHLSDRVLKAFRGKWKVAQAQNIDEISMLAPNKFYQIDHRARLATMKFEETMGGLATNACVDFLQLPPVDSPSIAMPLETSDAVMPETLCPKKATEDDKAAAGRAARWAEIRSGCRLWRDSFQTVTCLTLNMRTSGTLKDILDGMRRGELSDAAWLALQSRQIGMTMLPDGSLQCLPKGTTDPRLLQPPFSTHPITYIVHRHNLRVSQSYCNAVRSSLQRQVRLYISVAGDEAKDTKQNAGAFTSDVRTALLQENNLRKTEYLPSILSLYKGIRLLLYSKECVRLHLMNGCEVQLEDIVFAPEEATEMPDYVPAGAPVFLRYLPSNLLLRALGSEWTLPPAMLPHFEDESYDRRGLFLLSPETKYFTHALSGGETLRVRRTHYAVVPADTRIVYGAQGEGFPASIPDMRLPPGMDAAVHWLANYVMLSRATSLEALLILRLATRTELTHGAPQYLKDEIDRLLQLEKKSVRMLRDRLARLKDSLTSETLQVLEEMFVRDDIGVRSYTHSSLAKDEASCAERTDEKAKTSIASAGSFADSEQNEVPCKRPVSVQDTNAQPGNLRRRLSSKQKEQKHSTAVLTYGSQGCRDASFATVETPFPASLEEQQGLRKN